HDHDAGPGGHLADADADAVRHRNPDTHPHAGPDLDSDPGTGASSARHDPDPDSDALPAEVLLLVPDHPGLGGLSSRPADLRGAAEARRQRCLGPLGAGAAQAVPEPERAGAAAAV